ncbi:SPOR domain-containing protein [uncultured Draconibacterium sp.]|uniref:SPOR domain-containing protein n=1 Tax=uncultured Draconibacterium sp. TaxID=1573823 RepID=UPI00321711E6
MRILFLFLISVFSCQFIAAQESFQDELTADSTRIALMENLDVSRDPRLDKMLKWHIEKNEKREGIDGFRVEIFFSSRSDAKEEALAIKTDFLSDYPNQAVHIKFVAPNFRVRVGDFRTKNEAWRLYKQIQRDYPAAFIVPDVIDFPLLKQNQNE